MSKPEIHYFPLRGRAEVMKLILAAAKAEWINVDCNYEEMKKDKEAYPFGQCPRYVDNGLNICQSNSILRYMGRKYDMFGSNEAEHVAIDMVMEGVESLRMKYVGLIYTDRLADEAKATYWATYFAKDSTDARNGGAHVDYLAAFLRKNGGKFVAGSKLSVGDLCLFDIIDLHARIFPEQLKETYPELMAFHAAVSEADGVKEYLASPLRLPKINGNELG